MRAGGLTLSPVLLTAAERDSPAPQLGKTVELALVVRMCVSKTPLRPESKRNWPWSLLQAPLSLLAEAVLESSPGWSQWGKAQSPATTQAQDLGYQLAHPNIPLI